MNMLKRVICAYAIAFGATVAFADTWKDPDTGITWSYTLVDGEACVGGEGNWGHTAVPTSTKGEITIPSMLDGHRVTSVGDYAFSSCSVLTNVVIPSGVTNIGCYAFNWCTSLERVAIPSSVTSIGYCAFCGCSGLKSILIPSGVTHLSFDLFDGCSGLESIDVAKDNEAYASRDGVLFDKALTEIIQCPHGKTGPFEVPISVQRIGSSAFSGCSRLTSVKIPGSVTSIGDGSFYGCTGLTNASISAGVSSIGSYAFYGCKGLSNVTIPVSVMSLGAMSFHGCSGLTGVEIPGSVKSIGNDSFCGCSGLTNITISAGVSSVGSYAFYGCKGLTNVTIPASVMSIGGSSFNGCSGLTSVEIPGSVKSIGDSSFYGCTGLTNVSISAGVGSIGRYAFSGCSGLTSVTIPAGVTSVGTGAFDGCGSLTKVTLPDSVTCIDVGTFYRCTGLKSFVIPSCVTNIGAQAFFGCSGLTSVTIPSSVVSVGSGAFSGCTALGEGYVVENGWLLAFNDKNCRDVTVGGDIERIVDGVFSGCNCITSVTITAGLRHIGASAFGCSGIQVVHVDSEATLTGIDFEDALSNPLWCGGELYVDGHLRSEECSVTFVANDDQSYYYYGYLRDEYGQYVDHITKTVLFGRPFTDDPPQLETYGDMCVDHWETSGDVNWNCVTNDIVATPVLRRRTLQEMVDLYGSSGYGYGYGYDINSLANVTHAVYDEDSHCFRFQGRFKNDGDWYWFFRMLDREGTGDDDYSLRVDVVLYDKNGTECARAYGNRLTYDNLWFTTVWCSRPEDVGSVELKLASSFYEGPIQFGWYSAEEVERKKPRRIYYTSYGDRIYGDRIGDELRAGDVISVNGSAEWIAEASETYWIGNKSIIVPPNVFHVTFDVGLFGVRAGGGELEQDVDCEATGPEVKPDIEPLPGADFLGWDSGVWAEDMSEVTYTASYGNFVDFTITYADTKGQTIISRKNPRSYNLTSEIVFQQVLRDTVEWHFVGWEPASIAQGTYGDLVVTAKWEVARHTVRQTALYGEAPDVQTNCYGDVISVSAPTNVIWNGSLTNFVCLGSTIHLPATNQFEVVVDGEMVIPWDVWQTNYYFQTRDIQSEWRGHVVDENAALSGYHAHGTEVVLSAIADSGYRFYKWVGDVDGDPYENPKTFVMTQARCVEPVFVEEKVATPVVSIPNGTVLSNVSRRVSISCATPDSLIYYTLDGSDPSGSNGMRYTGAFNLGQTALLKAVAVKAGSDASEIASAAVVWLAAGQALPGITILPGSSVQPDKMIRVNLYYDAIDNLPTEVRYTVDGSDPTIGSPLYAGSYIKLVMDGTRFVKAARFANGVRIGGVYGVRYAPTIADVIVKTGEGCGTVDIQTESVRGWTLDETVQGRTGGPSMRSGKVSHGGKSSMTATFDGDGILSFDWRTSCEEGSEPDYDFFVDSARCYLDGELVAWLEGETEWTNVVVCVESKGPHELVWTYEKDSLDDTPYPGEDCAWVGDVKFTFSAYVDFASDEQIEGALPARIVSAAGYSVVLPEIGAARYARHDFAGWTDGAVTNQPGDAILVDRQEIVFKPVWTAKVLAPPAIEVADEYDDPSTKVSLAHPSADEIRYTLDGSDPCAESALYSGPFDVSGTVTVKAIAIKDDYFDSPVASKLSVSRYEPVAVSFDVGEGTGIAPTAINTGVRHEIVLPDIGEAANPRHAFSGWSLDGGAVLFKAGMSYSVTGAVTFVAHWTRKELSAPVISVAAEYDEASTVVEMTMTNVVGDIRYTLDGTEPASDSLLYTNAFEVSGSVTIRARVFAEDWFESAICEAATISTFEPIVIGFDVGPASGNGPEAVQGALRHSILLPSIAGASYAKHSFGGWTDGTSVFKSGEWYSVTSIVSFAAVWLPKKLPKPMIDVLAFYTEESTSVRIVYDDPASAIYYTTDGSSPNEASSLYDGVFCITGSCTVCAVARRDDWFDSDVAVATTVRAPWTLAECLNATNLEFRTDADHAWTRDLTVSADGVASLKSGPVPDKGGMSKLTTTVVGPGVLSFDCKTSSEADEDVAYDGLKVFVDGRHYLDGVAWVTEDDVWGGETDWRRISLCIVGDGEHTVVLSYYKDKRYSAGADCVWLDNMSWTASANRLPSLGDAPSLAAVAAVVADAKDPKVLANIDETNYNDFREWAGRVKAVGGDSEAGTAGVMASETAWLSYALGQDTLLGTAPTDDDLSVETFAPTAEAGKFDFTVSVKDVEVGSAATKENLKKVFGLEGAATLDDAAFSSDEVEIEFGTPVDGKVKFTAGPRDSSSSSFFMKVKMLQ